MKLQRYSLFQDNAGMRHMMSANDVAPNGEYVKHSEALDWFLSLLDYQYPSEEMTVYLNVAMSKERYRLRAIIEAERNKV